jgi:uncharacterized protein with von Willebrand factor type A (vWA) domain
VAFDVFFGAAYADDEVASAANIDSAADVGEAVEALVSQIADALATGDTLALREAIRSAVTELSGYRTGRPVGGKYYLYRVMQRLHGIEEALTNDDESIGLEARLDADEVRAHLELLETEIRREIVRRLVADRGPEPVARTLREPLAEDIDLMHATHAELARIEAAVAPLARKLATRLAHRRRLQRRGRLDVRRTIRRSLSHGGALIDPRFRPPRVAKPEIVLLCDVSGSMASFARFTMQFTYAMGTQFSRVRSFAFIDEVDEVTDIFTTRSGFGASMARLSEEARVVGSVGHSDYGAALRAFWGRHRDAITSRTTLIVAGDARNNFRVAADNVFGEIVDRARAAFWLNPEARRFWNTGDSIMKAFAASCTGVYEVRTLRQLERFVSDMALSRPGKSFIATP